MGSSAPVVLLLTCEHGGNAVPAGYQHLFRGRSRLLASHRGLDIGAREAAQYLQRRLRAPLVCATVTRLLVDLNRSVGHPGLFSELTRREDTAVRHRILAEHYHPYRELVTGWIAARLRCNEQVLHVSVHSFVPVLNGQRRSADVGLLYDPARSAENRFCRDWQAGLAACDHAWKVRRNFPYRGTSDGLTVALRRRFSAGSYAGIELELNQERLADNGSRRMLLRDMAETLLAVWNGDGWRRRRSARSGNS